MSLSPGQVHSQALCYTATVCVMVTSSPAPSCWCAGSLSCVLLMFGFNIYALQMKVSVKLEYPGHIILICEQLKKSINLHSHTLREVVTPQYGGLAYQKVLLVDPRSKASGPSMHMASC